MNELVVFLGAILEMLTAVHFYDQAMLMAIEIEDVASDRVLSAELVGSEAAVTKPTP